MNTGKSTVAEIIDIEWEMFRSVNDDGPKASCQNDRPTFEGMRRGQFDAWSAEAADSYLNDLKRALKDGRNLPKEKYIHMMRGISPTEYDQLASQVTFPTPGGMEYADEISDKLIRQTEALFADYPFVSGYGRPLHSSQDSLFDTSIETYLKSELITYSENTLELLLRHLDSLAAEGRSLAREMLENSCRYYGFPDLESAEAGSREHIETHIMSAPREDGASCCGDGCTSCGDNCDTGCCEHD